MKIAYVTEVRAGDVLAWSGLVYGIRECLGKTGMDIVEVDRVAPRKPWLLSLKERVYRKVLHRRYLYRRDALYRRAVARLLSRRIRGLEVDLFFSPTTLLCADLATSKPVVTWCDSTFGGLTAYYPGYERLAAETRRDAARWETESLRRTQLALYASDWAAQSAVQLHGAAPERIRVVPFGANLPAWVVLPSVADCLAKRPRQTCRLLLVGVDWVRKGGPLAAETCRRLHERGIPAELHVVGCNPPDEAPGYVKRHGFLSKAKTDQARQLLDLYQESHFLLLPSRAECYGVVLAEAAAYGLPSLAARTGGIPSAIAEGKNGWTFEPTADAGAYAARIETLWADPRKYLEQCHRARAEYDDRLSWEAAAGRLLTWLPALVDARAAQSQARPAPHPVRAA